MWRRLILAALASAAVLPAAWAQSTGTSVKQDDEALAQIRQTIRDKLTAQGFSDVKVAPSSYVVSARDKDGNRVMLMIGPTETTMMKVPDQNPSQAQTPNNGEDEVIQQ